MYFLRVYISELVKTLTLRSVWITVLSTVVVCVIMAGLSGPSIGDAIASVGENGVLLSGGERQRLALARALLGDPELILLDGGTSSLDGASEQRVQELIDRSAGDRARIVVAHRLSTVVDADLIIVVADGNVVAQGTHEDLLASSSVYQSLARNQLLSNRGRERDAAERLM